MISTNVTSKQFLEFVQELDKESDINLEDLLFYTSNYILWKYTTINSFYEGYYSPVKASLLGHLTIEQGDVNGIPIANTENVVGLGSSSGGGQSNGGESGSSRGNASNGSANQSNQKEGAPQSDSEQSSGQNSGGAKQLQIVNDGSCLLIKEGKMQAHLTKEQLRGLNWLNSSTTGAVITLEDVSDENLDAAKLIYKVQRQQILDRIEYVGGVPVYTANIKLFITLLESNGSKEDTVESEEPVYISDTVRKLIERQVKTEINSSLEFLAQNNADTLDMYERFYQAKRAETKDFMQTQNISPEEFLKNVVFKVIVSLFPV